NYRMSNITAGIGCGQMEVLDERVEARRKMNNFYHQLFRYYKGISLQEQPSSDFFSNYWLTAVIIEEDIVGVDREKIRIELLKHYVEVRPLWKPMHLQPVFSNTPHYGS